MRIFGEEAYFVNRRVGGLEVMLQGYLHTVIVNRRVGGLEV